MSQSTGIPDRLGREWAGATIAILGGGPSLDPQQIDLLRRTRTKTIAINSSLRLAPDADALYFCDEKWYRWNQALVKEYNGPIFTLENYKLRTELPTLRCLKNAGITGLSDDPTAIKNGRNSGYQVLNLLVHLGVTKVILLGMDMKVVNGKSHWHGGHKEQPTIPTVYTNVMLPNFKGMNEALKSRGMFVVNSSPFSNLTEFPQLPLKVALA